MKGIHLEPVCTQIHTYIHACICNYTTTTRSRPTGHNNKIFFFLSLFLSLSSFSDRILNSKRESQRAERKEWPIFVNNGWIYYFERVISTRWHHGRRRMFEKFTDEISEKKAKEFKEGTIGLSFSISLFFVHSVLLLSFLPL